MNSTETLGPHSDQYSREMALDTSEIAKPGLKKFL